MILNTLADKLNRRARDDFKGRHFETALIIQAVTWHLRYPLSTCLWALAVQGGFPVKVVADTLGVARSNLIQRLKGSTKLRQHYHKRRTRRWFQRAPLTVAGGSRRS